MAARNPDEIDALFEQALNAGDVDALLALYEPTATFTVEPGTIVSGTAAIREALTGFLALKPSISLKPKVIGNAGDVALVSSTWVLEGTGPDGKPVELTGTSAEVVRRQADGTWKFVVDSPWGLA
jgi:uncharacterized protein (TIGR02246 family)